MTNLNKYTQNLHIEGNKVISYTTHVATIDRTNNILYVHGHWSPTTSKHINYVADCYGLTKEDKEKGESLEQPDKPFQAMAGVMAIGEIFTENQKGANDWKLRMLKAGMGEGLIMPEDWETLSEDEKQKRLDKIVELNQ